MSRLNRYTYHDREKKITKKRFELSPETGENCGKLSPILPISLAIIIPTLKKMDEQ